MRRQDYVGTLQSGMNEWLIFVNIESRTGDFLAFESSDQSRLIHNRSAGSVNQESRRLHAEKLGAVE
jgi:hypothetical protein